MSGTTPRRSGPGGGALIIKGAFFVRAPPHGPLRRGVVPLTGYRGMSHALFFRLRESSNPRPKGHIEMGSTLTTNWASSSIGSESAPHFNMSLWSFVRALTEAKEKGMGHAPIACSGTIPHRSGPGVRALTSPVGSGNYLEWVSMLMVPGSSPRRRKKPL